MIPADPNLPVTKIVNEFLQIVLIGVFAATVAHWLYAHWRFRSILRQEQPKLLEELSRDAFAFAKGRGWINFALERKYRALGSERLQKAGDSLVNAIRQFLTLLAIYFLIFAIWFGVSLLVYAE